MVSPLSAMSGLSRRSVVGGLGLTAALGLGQVPRAAAQDSDFASHPLTGLWLSMTNPPQAEDPQFPVPSLYAADGTAFFIFPATQRGPAGVQVTSPVLGVWEPDSDRRGHFTAVQVLSDANGMFLGTVTIDGYPEVSENGQTFTDDGSRAFVTIRDASGAVVQEISGLLDRPVTAVRMGVGKPGFPASSDATPTT